MKLLAQLLMLCSVSLLASCATLDQAECETANWADIGFKDGASGYKPARLKIHTKACAKHDIGSDSVAYNTGFASGLNKYCVPDTGYRLGLNAETHHYLCPPEKQEAFLNAYVNGLERTLFMLDWRYSWLEHHFLLSHHHGHGTSNGELHEHSAGHYHHHRGSIRDRLDDVKYERLRIMGLIRRANTRLSKIPSNASS